MQRDYAWAAQTLADKGAGNVALATVDGSLEPELVKSLGVDGYPVLRIYRRGVHVGDHHGDRRHDKFVQVLLDEAKLATGKQEL
jgi:hypothetical protein